MNKTIRFSVPNISLSDTKIVAQVLRSGWLTHGRYTQKFEDEFKKFTKSKYAITVSSCTAALHLSCIAANFKKNDEVIVPAMTHTATAHAVEYTGAKVIFADINFNTGNLNLENIKKRINRKTKGVIVVHMAGLSSEIRKIKKFCKLKNLTLIEDCAHGLGTRSDGIHVGNFGISGCFSFYPTKQITTGEGGMLVTNNKKFYMKIKKLKAFGIDKEIKDRKKQGEYDVKSLGFNYRMTDFQAALGFRQIISYKKNLKKRREIAKLYKKKFENFKLIKTMPYSKNCSYFVFQIFCKHRDKLLKMLKLNNIGVSVHYNTPLPEMSYYKKKYRLLKKHYTSSYKYGETNISLPVYPELKKKNINTICKKITDFLKNEK